jgi:ATP-dependent DNA helicase DinG
MLNEVQGALSRRIPKKTVLLAQGLSGSREQIARLFQRSSRAVLLGTHSFWEGVDFPGTPLSCLVIAKLPFHVHTDPVVEARCELLRERGQDPFLSYSLPYAVLRFRQGFGRLIRRKEDKGVLVVCDKRVVTKRYGSAFLRSLPTPYRAVAKEEDLIRGAVAFLEGEDSPPPRYLDRESLRKLLSHRRNAK